MEDEILAFYSSIEYLTIRAVLCFLMIIRLVVGVFFAKDTIKYIK